MADLKLLHKPRNVVLYVSGGQGPSNGMIAPDILAGSAQPAVRFTRNAITKDGVLVLDPDAAISIDRADAVELIRRVSVAQAFTYSGWFLLEPRRGSSSDGSRRIRLLQAYAFGEYRFTLMVVDDKLMLFSEADSWSLPLNQILWDGKWHHIAVVVPARGEPVFVIDGAQTVMTPAGASSGLPQSAKLDLLGSQVAMSVAHVALHDCALSVADLNRLRRVTSPTPAELPVMPPGPVNLRMLQPLKASAYDSTNHAAIRTARPGTPSYFTVEFTNTGKSDITLNTNDRKTPHHFTLWFRRSLLDTNDLKPYAGAGQSPLNPESLAPMQDWRVAVASEQAGQADQIQLLFSCISEASSKLTPGQSIRMSLAIGADPQHAGTTSIFELEPNPKTVLLAGGTGITGRQALRVRVLGTDDQVASLQQARATLGEAQAAVDRAREQLKKDQDAYTKALASPEVANERQEISALRDALSQLDNPAADPAAEKVRASLMSKLANHIAISDLKDAIETVHAPPGSGALEAVRQALKAKLGMHVSTTDLVNAIDSLDAPIDGAPLGAVSKALKDRFGRHVSITDLEQAINDVNLSKGSGPLEAVRDALNAKLGLHVKVEDLANAIGAIHAQTGSGPLETVRKAFKDKLGLHVQATDLAKVFKGATPTGTAEDPSLASLRTALTERLQSLETSLKTTYGLREAVQQDAATLAAAKAEKQATEANVAKSAALAAGSERGGYRFLRAVTASGGRIANDAQTLSKLEIRLEQPSDAERFPEAGDWSKLRVTVEVPIAELKCGAEPTFLPLLQHSKTDGQVYTYQLPNGQRGFNFPLTITLSGISTADTSVGRTRIKLTVSGIPSGLAGETVNGATETMAIDIERVPLVYRGTVSQLYGPLMVGLPASMTITNGAKWDEWYETSTNIDIFDVYDDDDYTVRASSGRPPSPAMTYRLNDEASESPYYFGTDKFNKTWYVWSDGQRWIRSANLRAPFIEALGTWVCEKGDLLGVFGETLWKTYSLVAKDINLRVTTDLSDTFIDVTGAPSELQINGRYRKAASSPEAHLRYNDWFTKVDNPDLAFGYRYSIRNDIFLAYACFFGMYHGRRDTERSRFVIAGFEANDPRLSELKDKVDFLDTQTLPPDTQTRTLKPGRKQVRLWYYSLTPPAAFDTSFDCTGYTVLQASGALTVGADATFTGNKLTTIGKVGIGTQTPQQQLDVVGNIHASGTVTAINVAVASDARLKDVLARSDSKADLARLAAIEIVDYRYRDQQQYGSGVHKKIAAQQVEIALPNAVSRIRGVMPDIMAKARVRDGWIELATVLTTGELVQILFEQTANVVEVLETRDGAFRVAIHAPSDAEVFVYGRAVDDLRVVDYDAIAMLNVSATQELARQLSAAQAEIGALRTQLGQVNAMIENQRNQIDRMLPSWESFERMKVDGFH